MYLPACFVKRSVFNIVLDIWITVSFLHQILDYTEMSIPNSKIYRKLMSYTLTGGPRGTKWMYEPLVASNTLGWAGSGSPNLKVCNVLQGSCVQ